MAGAHASAAARGLLFVRTFFLLLAAKLALILVPVERVLRWDQSPAHRTEALTPEERRNRLRMARWAIQSVTKRSPIEFVCFPQSLAARRLLHAQGIETKLYYGVMRKDGKLATHTWLVADDFDVIGGAGSEAFSVLAIY